MISVKLVRRAEPMENRGTGGPGSGGKGGRC